MVRRRMVPAGMRRPDPVLRAPLRRDVASLLGMQWHRPRVGAVVLVTTAYELARAILPGDHLLSCTRCGSLVSDSAVTAHDSFHGPPPRRPWCGWCVPPPPAPPPARATFLPSSPPTPRPACSGHACTIRCWSSRNGRYPAMNNALRFGPEYSKIHTIWKRDERGVI